jgi:cellulose 1,4-beta-cellobiosidase
MDIWEANSISAAYTPHPCKNNAQHICSGDSCGGTYSNDRYGGDCDPDGCDFNSYRMGNTSFYGAGMTVDTKSKFTVVTQFLTSSDGSLSDIKRFYVQNGRVIPNSVSNIAGVSGNSVTADFCKAQKSVFGDIDDFGAKGGLKQMGAALRAGMVLVMSIWDDHASSMLWLDSTFPVTGTGPGAKRGSCSTSSGVPAEVEANAGNSKVVFSNIRFGPVGSTFNTGNTGGGGSTSQPPTQSTTRTTSQPAPTGGTVAHYAQCGGIGYTGATACVSPYTCNVVNPYYSQCL